MRELGATVETALKGAFERIRDAAVGDSARLDAELLVGRVAGLDRVGLRTRGEQPLDAAQLLRLEELVIRRCTGEPIAYLLGTAWFYGREFEVDARVLVPRPETELLVELALDHLDAWPGRGTEPTYVVDACTGSGCVGVSIGAEAVRRYGDAEVRVMCTDISEDAIDVARTNVAAHAPDVLLRQGDLLRPVAEYGPFAVVVANPPYVEGEFADGLEPGVRAHEPHIALFAPAQGGVDALVDRLAREALDLLEPGGLLAIEHGQGQGTGLVRVLERRGYVAVRDVDDLAGIDRVVVGIAPQVGADVDSDEERHTP